MKAKANRRDAPGRPPSQVAALEARIEALERDLEQKDQLVDEGFRAFTDAAERLKQRVDALNLQVEQKNQELERNLIEKEKVKTYLSNIFENLAIGVLVTDLDGAVTSVNRAGSRLLGLSGEEMVGEGVDDLLGAPVLSDHAPAGEEGVSLEEPITYARNDGESLRLEVSVNRMLAGDKALGFILNVQDVTLLKRLEEHAARRNRLTAMGEMAANMAHEIRNPLGSIELFASLVRKGLPEDDERQPLMNHIFSAVRSMNHIISNLLQYSKPRPVHRDRLDVHALLAEVLEFSRYQAEQNGVRFTEALEAPRPDIRGDRELLKQVFHNLILNAVQAMPEGGALSIATRELKLADPKLLARFGDHGLPRAELDAVEVRFQDTGVGMPKEVQNQIFDPFFTTKAQGTGLGLAIANNILESHHATIDVESRVNRGTTLILMFPLAAPSAATGA